MAAGAVLTLNFPSAIVLILVVRQHQNDVLFF
jgi:hypothetical protein